MISWTNLRQALLATTCLAVVGTVLAPQAAAAPSGLSVGSGQITVGNPNAQTTLIQQGSGKAVLNWNSFSIARGESVVFHQPSSSSVALNRVTGGQASSILGNLTANGHVVLLNPNGILFGQGAMVNVGSLIATTSDIRDSDFLAGNYNFGIASANPNAGIINQGTIQAAAGGSVVLSAPYVRNDGVIQANLGKVVVGGASTFAVSFNGDTLLSYAVTGPVTQVPVDQNGNPVTALVTNTGSIIADGGQVTLTARAAKNILDNVINTTGIVEANTASMVNGTVVFDAGDGGVTVGGSVSATGLNPGETGGTVKVLGGAVTIASGATISASGDAGGGNISIGGDFHGAGPDANAWTTDVQPGATILADAVTYGNGGNIAVWADGYTAFNGAISAQGGALGGNGGFVETSGKQGLSVQTGSVNTLAPNGQGGNWLLDPTNIVIQTGGSTTPITSDPFANNPGGTDTIDPSAIQGAAANSTVTLQATNSVTFNTGLAMTNNNAGLTVQAGGNITFTSGVGLRTTGGNVSLSANDNSAGTATGSGGITLANAGISTTGRTATSATITSGSSTITVASTSGLSVGQSISAAGIPGGTTITGISGNTITLSAAATGSGSNVFFRSIPSGSTAAGGSITLTTNGGTGAINLGTAGLMTGGGAITLSGPSISSSTGAPGISSSGSNVGAGSGGGIIKLTSTNGGITLAGGVDSTGGVSSGGAGGNGGSITISSVGAVDIGGGMSIVTIGSGAQMTSQTTSLNASGFSPGSSTTQTTGNGGAISVTGTSITLELGANSAGGNDLVSGSAQNGGAGGNITLTANGGTVRIGGDSAGSIIGLVDRGGDTRGGSGGSGGNISVTGTAISTGGKLVSRGGDTFATSGVTGGNAGSITLTATGTDGAGHSIRLFGTSDSPTDTSPTGIIGDIAARGGQIGITQQSTETGTVTGNGSNITLQGANGGTLQGDVILQTSTASSLNGGSTVGISVGGGTAGLGGTLTINGAVDATTANVESLRLFAGNGAATVTGGVGAGTALNSLVFGSGFNNLASGTGGSITLQGPVAVGTQIQDLRGSGSLTFNGLINTPSLQMNQNGSTSLAMNGGGIFSGNIKTNTPNPITVGGNFVFTSTFSGNFSGIPPFVLSGSGGFDSSALNVPVSLSSITGNNFSLALNAGSGNITVGAISNARLVLGGSGSDTFNNASGLSFDFSRFNGTAIVNGTKVFPVAPSSLAPFVRPIAPPISVTPFTIAPPPPVTPISFAPITPIVTAPAPLSGPLSAPSDNAPTTVEGTDTGGSMFTQISSTEPATPSSGSSGSGGATGSSGGTSSTSTSGTDTSGTGTSSSSTSTTSSGSGTTTASGSSTTAPGSRGSNTASTAPGTPATSSSTSAGPTPPPDSSDRALSVIAAPPPVRSVSHELPTPPRVTAPVVPGFVSQVQHPPVAKSGTPGIRQNFSASGNAGRW